MTRPGTKIVLEHPTSLPVVPARVWEKYVDENPPDDGGDWSLGEVVFAKPCCAEPIEIARWWERPLRPGEAG